MSTLRPSRPPVGAIVLTREEQAPAVDKDDDIEDNEDG